MTEEQMVKAVRAMIPMNFVLGCFLLFLAHVGLSYEDSPMPMWFIACCLWLSGASTVFALTHFNEYYPELGE
jgi:hypothetical protein